jgi:hypothetical protein
LVKVLIDVLKALVGIIATAILTAWLTGQPLTGLTKIKGLYETFIRSKVPAWAFSVVFLAAVYGMYSALAHWFKREPKPTVHFIPDAHNSGWSKQTASEMNLRVGGMFTYQGPDQEIQVLKAYLAGTKLTTDMLAQTESSDGRRQMLGVTVVWLLSDRPVRYIIDLKLAPVLGTPGQPLRRKLILLDNLNREFPVGPIDFPYIGPKVS